MLKLCHGLEDRLLDGSNEEISDIADLVSVQWFLGILYCLILFYKLQKGAHGSRADDTKGMKGAILDWISVDEPLVPSLHRRNKADRGFNHQRTGALLCPAGLDWNIPEQVSYDIVLVSTYKSILEFDISFAVVSYMFRVTNGLPFSTHLMILRTHGVGF